MKKYLPIIFIVLLLPLSVYAAEQKVYVLRLNYEAGSLSADTVFVTVAHFNEEKNQPENAYRLELASFENTILYTIKFNPVAHRVYGAKPEWFDEKGNQIYIPNESESSILLDWSFTELMIPYFKNGKIINIYEPNSTKVLSIDVGYFADVCGDGICEPHEKPENCPQDCPAGKGTNGEIAKGKGNFILLLVGILAFIITVAAIFGFRIHKSQSKSSLENYVLTATKKGFSAKQIRENLLKAGYSEKDVDAVFRKILRK